MDVLSAKILAMECELQAMRQEIARLHQRFRQLDDGLAHGRNMLNEVSRKTQTLRFTLDSLI